MEHILYCIGSRIKQQRKMNNMTLDDLSKKSRVSKGNLSKIENTPANTSLITLYRIANALRVPVSALLPRYIGK
jgi:transcriptional regulator with XRE-family HTH domain